LERATPVALKFEKKSATGVARSIASNASNARAAPATPFGFTGQCIDVETGGIY